MAVIIIPFEPSIGHYRFSTTISNTEYIFDVRWNSRDSAWYFDLLEFDETPIIMGVKIVLGTYLGRRCTHALFYNGVFVAIDTSNEGREAGFDDLGTRVTIRYYPAEDLITEQLSP